MRRRRIAFTLIELLVVLAIFGIIIAGTTRALSASLSFNVTARNSRAALAKVSQFESQLRALLQQAFLSSITTDTNSYFIGGTASDSPTTSTTGSASDLTFTILGDRLSSDALTSRDDFETINQRVGPVGAPTEVNLSFSPQGNATVDAGFFIRKQTPADGDPSQGGVQSVLSTDLSEISYEFWDGTQWLTEWDTRTQNEPRLPAAVRVTYRFDGEDVDRIFVVRLIHSDVTAENPAQTAVAQ